MHCGLCGDGLSLGLMLRFGMLDLDRFEMLLGLRRLVSIIAVAGCFEINSWHCEPGAPGELVLSSQECLSS